MTHASIAVRSLLLAQLLLTACSEDTSGTVASPSRVVAVSAARNTSAEHELCDILKTPENAAKFEFPAIEGTPDAEAKGWRWINLWATWCPPCIEELPLIKRLQRNLSTQKGALSLELLSVDVSREVVEKFGETHPDAKDSLRVLEPSSLATWLVGLGLDAGATLPVHLFVDPQGKVRCARTGAVRESDEAAIKKLISGS